ncbi:MAG TPA: hypothetical protein VIM71_13925 [Lacunisphaera sp.]
MRTPLTTSAGDSEGGCHAVVLADRHPRRGSRPGSASAVFLIIPRRGRVAGRSPAECGTRFDLTFADGTVKSMVVFDRAVDLVRAAFATAPAA